MANTLGFGKHKDTPIDELPNEYLYGAVTGWFSPANYKLALLYEELVDRVLDGTLGEYWTQRYYRWAGSEHGKYHLTQIPA